MISIVNLKFEYGIQTIFEDVTTTIDGKVNALVGRNGSGKTTLFKLIASEINPTAGSIIIPKSKTIGYLKQEFDFPNLDMSVGDYILSQIAFYNRYNELLHRIQTENSSEDLLHKFADAETEFNNKNGYSLQEKMKTVLQNLGFASDKLKIRELSYGYRMRALLAKLLMEENDILLLDEPTNHLDLPSIKWLESFLTLYPGMIILVSHDRAFLDNVCTSTIEIALRGVRKYSGNYTFYRGVKQARDEQSEKEKEGLIEEAKRLEELVSRIKGNVKKAKIASSRQKNLDKIMEKVNSFESEITSKVKLRGMQSTLKSRIAMEALINDKTYDKESILNNIEMKVEPDERIFLIGANGRGKSTLLRILAGTDRAFDGEVKHNESLEMLYFDFDKIAQLKDEKKVLDLIYSDGMTEHESKALLGMMMFHEDDYEKKISVLSGGEKVRLYLAKLFCQKFNFLILDEPTNYLDIETVEVLIDWLKNIQTGFIIVTHNEYLLKSVEKSNIWTIKEGRLLIHYGNYNDFVYYSSQKDAASASFKNPVLQVKRDGKKLDRQSVINKRIEINREIKRVEKEVEILESEKKLLFEKLSDMKSYKSGEQIKESSNRFKAVEVRLEYLYRQWEEFIESMPELEEK